MNWYTMTPEQDAEYRAELSERLYEESVLAKAENNSPPTHEAGRQIQSPARTRGPENEPEQKDNNINNVYN